MASITPLLTCEQYGSLGHSLPIHSDALRYFLVDTTITNVDFIETKLVLNSKARILTKMGQHFHEMSHLV